VNVYRLSIKKPRAIFRRVTVFGLVILFALTACSGGSDRDVASISGSRELATVDAAQAAEVLTACMSDGAVELSVDVEDGTVTPNDGSSYFVSTGGGGVLAITETGLSDKEWNALAQSFRERAEVYRDSESGDVTGPVLLIGDGDYTSVWRECLESSGYVAPPMEKDPKAELEAKAAMAGVARTWAECARSNGFPTTRDPLAPVADDFMTVPTALLPASITPPELEALFEVCDPGPSGAERVVDETDDAVTTVPIPAPAIGIDVPGFDGLDSERDEQSKDFERLVELEELIYQAQEAAPTTPN
jgi:hypothetical protein